MFKNTGLLTLPTPAVISPSPLSLPRQNHCPGTRLAANMAAAALLTLNDTDTAGKGSDTGVDIHE
jgi:hypothetical protein